MAIKRYQASSDNTITNAFSSNLSTRGTGSNMGLSDILEVFSIYGQTSSSAGYSTEESKILLNFPVSNILSDRSSSKIPASGSVKFYLNLFNAVHPFTVPRKYTLNVAAVSSSWEEGNGLDMDEYSDLGYSNWVSSSATSSWTTQGGDFLTSSACSCYFESGTEDLSLDITNIVEGWLNSSTGSYGLGIYLAPSHLTETSSYYTKKFFGRESEFFFYRPYIEARWNSQMMDDRGNFYISSSLLTTENVNTIYLYNFKNGQGVNIPGVGTGNVYVKLYETLGSSPVSLPTAGGVNSGSNTVCTGGWVSTGIYSASMAYVGTASVLYDVWFSGSNIYNTGTINTTAYSASQDSGLSNYVLSIKNSQTRYFTKDIPRFRLYTRQRDWNPTIYSIAVNEPETLIIEKAYYRLIRIQDNFEVVPYGTGSNEHTLMSFDKNGNYFDFDMSILEKGYMYAFKFAFYEQQNGEIEEQPYTFKFRVEE